MRGWWRKEKERLTGEEIADESSVVVAGREMVLYVRGQAGFGESTAAARIFKVTSLINAIAGSLCNFIFLCPLPRCSYLTNALN